MEIAFVLTEFAFVTVGFAGEVDNNEDTDNVAADEAAGSAQSDARLVLNPIPPTIPSPKLERLA